MKIKPTRHAKRQQRGAFREGDCPTAEQFARGHWQRHYDTRLSEQDDGQSRGWRRQHPVDRWFRDGWIDQEQAKALFVIAGQRDRAELALSHRRSCLDRTPVGHQERGGLPEQMALALLTWERTVRELGALLRGDLGDVLMLLGSELRCEELYASLWPHAATTTRVKAARDLVHRLARAATEIV